MSGRREMQVGIIGAGVMAEAMIAGLLADHAVSADRLVASHPRRERRESLAERHGIGVVAANADVLRETEIIVLAVKPQMLARVMRELHGQLRDEQVVLSIVAGAKLGTLTRGLAHAAVVRDEEMIDRVQDREARLHAEEHRRVAVCQVKVHQQRRMRGEAAERGGQVDRNGRAAHASLRANDAQRPAQHRSDGVTGHARDGRGKLFLLDGFGHPLVDAHAHGLEHLGRLERPRDDHHSGRRKLLLQLRHFTRQPLERPDVHHEGVGTLGAERMRGVQAGKRHVRGAEAPLAELEEQVAVVGAHEGNGNGHRVTSPTRS